MAGILGSRSFDTYRREMARIVSENKHQQLLAIDPEYREAWEKFLKATEEKDKMPVRQMYKKKMASIAAKYKNDLKFTKSKANRDKLIISCLPMVVAMAKRFIGRAKSSVHMDDLIQAGNLGLCIAADNYLKSSVAEGQREAKFSTVAYAWIFKYVSEEAHRQSTPFGGQSAHVAYQANMLTTTLAQTATGEDGDFTNDTWDDSNMNKLREFKELTIASDELKAFRMQSKKLFSILNKEEKRILFMAYGIDTPNNVVYSAEEIGKMLGVARQTIWRAIKNAIYKLNYSARGQVSGTDLLNFMAQIHAVDMSQVPEWTIEDTY